jgi:hypothetical protein
VLGVGVVMLYAVRKADQRPLHGRWLLVIAAVYVIVPAVAWYEAVRLGLLRSVVRHAVALTVPLGQLALLLLALGVFERFAGRPPGQFTFHGDGQSNVDTLMHGFVFFIVGIGGFAVCATFLH